MQNQIYDRIFFALSNSTRRGMAEILMREGPQPMSKLARPFGISAPGAKKHIGIMEDAGIVECRRLGREKICSLNAGALEEAERWFTFHAQFWNGSLDRLGKVLERRKP